MKFKDHSPFTTPEAAERKLLETIEADHAGRIQVVVVNMQLREACGSTEDCRAAVKAAVRHGMLTLHPSGGYLTFTQAGAEIFA